MKLLYVYTIDGDYGLSLFKYIYSTEGGKVNIYNIAKGHQQMFPNAKPWSCDISDDFDNSCTIGVVALEVNEVDKDFINFLINHQKDENNGYILLE